MLNPCECNFLTFRVIQFGVGFNGEKMHIGRGGTKSEAKSRAAALYTTSQWL